MLLPVPAANVADLPKPLTTSTPDSVIGPPAVTLKFPLTVEAPRSIPFTSFTATSLPLPINTVVKSLFWVSSVMSFPEPAENVAVAPAPFTFNAPLSVIAPPAVTLKFPLKVSAGNWIGAASNASVKLRNPVGKAN